MWLYADRRAAVLGYSVAPWLWGRGLATEAGRAVIDAAYASDPELDRVSASCHVRNVASLRVLDKLGMTREGVLRRNRWLRGEPLDEACFGTLRSEWQR